jgi:hypothetical protein
MFNTVAPQLERRAVAWVASINGAKCIKPWSIPITKVWSMAGDTDQQLDLDEIARLKAMSDYQRTLMLTPPPKTSPGPNPPPPGPDGQWDPIVYDHPGANTESKTTQAVTGGVPGGGQNQTPVCYFKAGAGGTCYASATASQPGVKTLVVYGTTAVFNGKEQVTVKMIGEWLILCYKRGPADKTCNDPKYPNLNPYMEGAMVGRILPTFWNLGDVEYGNVPSIASKLILVK